VIQRRLAAVLLVTAGAGGAALCVRSAYAGMRDVMATDGGSCASGGPYAVAHQCAGADSRLLVAGILGGLLSASVLAVGTSLLGRNMPGGLLTWTALFAALGWNFVSLGLRPPAGQSGSAGWVVCGVVFWLLALGGLVPAASRIGREMRRVRRPDPVRTAMQPLVRAIQLPGLAVAQGGPPADAPASPSANGAASPRPAVRQRQGGDPRTARLWLAAAAAGTTAGVLGGSAFVTLLR
jgi:hypothetical protein